MNPHSPLSDIVINHIIVYINETTSCTHSFTHPKHPSTHDQKTKRRIFCKKMLHFSGNIIKN